MTPTLSHDAESFVSLLWQHIYQRVRGMLHPHHHEHEPGGKDEVSLPLGFLSNVSLTTPTNEQTLVYNSTLKVWENGAAAASAVGQAFFEETGTLAVGTTPGPTNLTGSTLTITQVVVKSDGEVVGTVTAGGAFSFPAGGGTDNNTGLSYAWTDGSALSITLSSATSGTYLTADVLFTR